MRKAVIAVVTAVVAMGVMPLIAAAPASADPCAGLGPQARAHCGACLLGASMPDCANYVRPTTLPAAPPNTPAAPPTQAPPSVTPVQTPQVKPPSPPPPSAVPVQTPKINPPARGAPKNAPLVTPPKHVDAPQQAVAAAKAAPAARIDPANPPKPSTSVDFNLQAQNIVSAHSGNVDIVNAGNQALTRPRVWDYVDYDVYHRPALYNPLTEATTFRYFYSGVYRDLTVPAGGRAVLDIATVGVFPFTAVSDSYLASGSFNGGAWIPPDGGDGPPPPDYTPPPSPQVYQDVSAYVPADNVTVQVGQVTVVGHDDSLPTGAKDIFMLDDSTLAWGQVNDPSSNAQITVTKTQSVPGVGPTDNGSFLVTLADHKEPTDLGLPWRWARGVVVLVVAAGVVTWTLIRRKRKADPTVNT